MSNLEDNVQLVQLQDDYYFVQQDRELEEVVDFLLDNIDDTPWEAEWFDDVTGAVYEEPFGSGEIWVTESSRYYELGAWYELVWKG